jgi:hypothetical protein
MAGAFVGVADDATAIYWNPAGLKTGSLFSVVVERQAFDTIPDTADSGGLNRSSAFVGLGTWPVGIAYYRLRRTSIGVPDLDSPGTRAAASLITHHTAVTALQSLTDRITVGAALEFVRGIAAVGPIDAGARSTSALLDEAASRIGRAQNRLDLHLGVMAEFSRGRVGLVARNLRAPGYESPDGTRLEVDRQVRAGAALVPNPAFTVAVDVDLTRTTTVGGDQRNVAVGVERLMAGDRLGLRGGVRFNTIGDPDPVGAAGMSVTVVAGIFVEGQLTYGHRDGDRGWGLGGRLVF